MVKQVRKITMLLLIVLILAGWSACIFGRDNQSKADYDQAIMLAEDYMSRGLYQLAIIEYENAIAVRESREVWDAMFYAYELWYQESDQAVDSYLNALERALIRYDDSVDYQLRLAQLYQEKGDDMAAYRSLSRARERGVESEELDALLQEVTYAFDTGWHSYSDFLPYCNGTYAVMNLELWGYVDGSGSDATDLTYSFASRTGAEGLRVVADEDGCVLVDEQGIIRGKLAFVPESVGVYAEGLIPLEHDGTVGYYNSLGDHQFGGYLAASSFQDERAAVETGKDVWKLIDTQGQEVSGRSYQEIRVNQDGTYIRDNVMLAKVDGQFQLYDREEKVIGSFSCDDLDVLTEDGLIAFERDGKWGFVDTEGNEVLSPAYESAKSFSNGLAAVCQNGQWGFIDREGNLAIEYQFMDADYFNDQSSCMVRTTVDGWQIISLKIER